jgi:hypothetical protein
MFLASALLGLPVDRAYSYSATFTATTSSPEQDTKIDIITILL